MSLSFPSSQYRYSGRRYDFQAYIYTAEAPSSTKCPIDQNGVVEFSYVNRLGELCVTGEMIYVDETGLVVNFMREQYPMMDVVHSGLVEDRDGPFADQRPDPRQTFSHTFFVNSIAIINRDGVRITYRLSLVSANWFKCVKNVRYSNYGRGKADVLSILRECMVSAGLECGRSFDSVKTQVAIDYITNGNDNMFTISKYLFNKTCYYDVRDESMKFLYYDDRAGVYGLYDLAQPFAEKRDGNRVVVSMDKNDFETMAQQEPTQLASVESFPRTDGFTGLFNRKVFEYDSSSNTFVPFSIDSASIVQTASPPSSADGVVPERHSVFHDKQDYIRNTSMWQADTDVYGEQLRTMLDCNSLILNTAGVVTRCPADTIQVVVSKDRSDVKTEDVAAKKSWEVRYKALHGRWFVAQVRHMISPSRKYYKQNLVLFRNFAVQS